MKLVQAIKKEPTIWGPVFLLASFAFVLKSALVFDLFFVAGVGVFLSATMQIRGFCYGLILLSIDSTFRHLFFIENHLWYLGIEISFALAFWITALCFEEGSTWIESLKAQIQIGKTSYENLEEEFAKQHESAQSLQIASTEKIAMLQKTMEELESEHASILILNEVLRKKTARFEEEGRQHLASRIDLENQMHFLKAEYAALQKEYSELANTNEMALLNSQLMQELNAARFDKEQAHLINETLQRLYLKESLKVKDIESEASSLKELLVAANQLIGRLKHFDPRIEPLFRQLKKQFEEKSKILEETRKDLFRSDTELQKLKIEKAMFEQNPVPKEVEEELIQVYERLELLEEENRTFQEMQKS